MTQTRYIRIAKAAELVEKDVETLLLEAIEGGVQLFVMLDRRFRYSFRPLEDGPEDWIGDGELPAGMMLAVSPEHCSGVLLTGRAETRDLGEIDGKPAVATKLSGAVQITPHNIFMLSAQVNLAAQTNKSSSMEQPKPMPLRAETTYQNIIAALLAYIAGEVPGIDRHPSYSSDRTLIKDLAAHFKGYGGLSESNLSRKLPEAKRSLDSQ